MAATEFREFAPAKVNLFLHVLGRRPDGYHELDSLVVFAEVGDHLTAVPAAKMGLGVTGPFADQLRGTNMDDNLVLRAAKVTEEWAWGHDKDLPPFHFTLEKHLPVASGMGGGSADAGAAMRLCAKAAGLAPDDNLYARAATLGADVPVCLRSHPAWMSGAGEKLEPARLPPGLALVLVNPGVEISTGQVFDRYRMRPAVHVPQPRRDFSSADELIGMLKETGNDLQGDAMEMAPVIRRVIDEIDATAPLLARMSGSGATCFGLYASEEEAQFAAHAIREAHHDWWVAAGALLA